jgi:hypothetical protein
MTWNGEEFAWTHLDAVVGVASALFGALATVATLVALGLTMRTANREHRARMAAEERANRLEDEARAEAAQVLARAERAQASRISIGVDRFVGFRVKNGTNALTRSARAQAFHPSAGAMCSSPMAVVDPGGSTVLQEGTTQFQNALPEHLWDYVPYAVAFLDDGDRWWARFSSGDLLRLPDDVDAGKAIVAERLEQQNGQANT